MTASFFAEPEVFQLVESECTNDDTFQYLREREAVALWTLKQSQGRGSRGRQWISPPGAGLAFSIGWKNAPLPSKFPFSIWAGVALFHAMTHCFPHNTTEFSLKWPNDLLFKGNKLAGILCESRWTGMTQAQSVIGIGLNILNHPDLNSLEKPWTTLQAEGLSMKTKDIVKQLLSSFKSLSLVSTPQIQELWDHASCWRKGNPMKINNSGTPTTGTYCGINSNGALLLKDQRSGRLVAISHADSDFEVHLQ